MRIWRKLLFLFRRGKFDRDLEEEIRSDQAEFSEHCRNPILVFRMRSASPCPRIYNRPER